MIVTIAKAVSSVILLRAGGILLWGITDGRIRKLTRSLCGLIVACCIAALLGDAILQHIAKAYLYFAGASYVVFAAARSELFAQAGRVPAAVISTLLGIAIPALLVPSGPRTLFLILGWEFAFSAYSYYLDRATATKENGAATALWFCLVDPNLVFSSRARWAPDGHRTAVAWYSVIGWISTFMFVTAMDLCVVSALPMNQNRTEAVMGVALLQALVFCAKQISVAGWQVSLLRAQGYSIADRYVAPHRSISPEDFWRRWNTYLTGWIFAYWVVPLSKHLRRPSFRQRAIVIGSVFLSMGMLHDLVIAIRDGRWSPAFTLLFLLHGLAFICWPSRRRLRSGRSRQLSRAAFCIVFFGIAVSALLVPSC